MDLLSDLDRDYRRLDEVAAGNLGAQVPTCPEWTVEDLVRHVAQAYQHKTECMRRNEMPKPWPPDTSAEPAMDLLHRSYADLRAEFTSREPGSPAATWFGPDQTVGFWVRRMAQETVIHRIDAELGAGGESLPIPEDLALDGIDEVLRIFVTWGCDNWPEDYAEALSKGDGSVSVQAGPVSWLVSWEGDKVRAEPSIAPAQAQVSGSAEEILRWLWRRSEDSGVSISGDLAKVAQLREIMREGTQ